MNTALLNEVVNFLSSNGVTPENTPEFKNAVINLCIKTLVDAGMEVREAFDTIMGDGSYHKMSVMVWESLNAKA